MQSYVKIVANRHTLNEYIHIQLILRIFIWIKHVHHRIVHHPLKSLGIDERVMRIVFLNMSYAVYVLSPPVRIKYAFHDEIVHLLCIWPQMTYCISLLSPHAPIQLEWFLWFCVYASWMLPRTWCCGRYLYEKVNAIRWFSSLSFAFNDIVRTSGSVYATFAQNNVPNM